MKRCRLRGHYVPRELEEQILLKLPVKSLVRFRSVGKDWNSLITGQKFVKDHLQWNASKPSSSSSSLLLGWAHDDPFAVRNEEGDDVDLGEKQILYRIAVGDSVANTSAKEEVHLPIRPTLLGDGSGALISLDGLYCDGIVCLVDCSPYISHRIAFYNPAPREHVLARTSLDYELIFCCSGFGRDPRTDDYKFVRLLGHESTPWISKAEVYSLRTGLWREIELHTRWYLSGSPGAYLKGRVYWHNFVGEDVLVRFDVSDESFGTVDLPRPRRKWTEVMPLLAWKGSLAFFNKVGSFFEMWVMDDGGWSRYYRLGLLGGFARPIAFCN